MVADTYELTAGPGDRLLLCSDGLTGMLEDAMIAETLATYTDPAAAARALVDAANDAGGHDNISVVIVDVGGESAVRGATVDPSGARRGRGWLALIGWLLLFALIVGGVVFAAYHVADSRAYLTAENGVVVIYQGVPGQLRRHHALDAAPRRPPSPSPTSISRSRRGCRRACRCRRSRRRERAVESYRADHRRAATPPSPHPPPLPPDAVPSAP